MANVLLIESPVEFVIIGPVHDYLRVLVKSKNAGIDLIGYSQDEYEELHISPSSDLLTSLAPQKVFSKSFDQITYRAIDYDYSKDAMLRPSAYKFIWRGVHNQRLNQNIQHLFNDKLPDIINAIKKQDLDTLEWTLAIIIALANNAIIQKKRKRIQIAAIAILYTIIVLLGLSMSDLFTRYF